MNSVLAAIRQFFDLFRLWVIVAPWEQGLRVRLGRRVTLLNAGVHLRIPGLDVFYIQSVRQRISSFGRQTVTTKDGKVVTFSGAIGYAIQDIEQLYQTLHHAEDTIQGIARARLAEYFAGKSAFDMEDIDQEVGGVLGWELKQYGLSEVRIYLTDFAVVKTYRLIGDYGYGTMGSMLTTDQPYTRTTSAPA